jgi:ferredoxin-NADP reductase/MOSC domain-containing protein YiiM
VNVGMPTDVEWQGRTVHTGIWKRSVPGPQMVRRLNIDGDGQGDLQGHGGEQRAVLVYQIESYQHWQEHFDRDDFSYGQFGENLTVDGLDDGQVCIGDRYRIGTAEFEVTQPRVTCYRVGLRLGEPNMPALLVSHRRPGFYMRVLTEGRIQAGDEIERILSGPGGVTVREADALLYLPNPDLERVRVAAGIPALSPGWQGSFHEMLAAAGSGAGTGAPIPAEPAWSGFRRLRVTRIVPESTTIASIELAAEDSAPLPAARPGQYLTLRLPDAGQPAPVRSFSLSSAPGRPTYRITVKREPHGVVSSYLHTRLRPGVTVEVAAPRGEFVLDDGAWPVLLISAGVGVTPVLAMLHALVDQGSSRSVWWLHAARNAAEHALAREAAELLHRLPHAQAHIFYSAPPPGDSATGVTAGRLTADVISHLGLPADAAAYICGPSGFMTDVAAALAGVGLDAARVHTELFTPQDAINPGVVPRPREAPHQPRDPADAGPLITFARSGLSVTFDDRWRSLLELAEACGVPTRWSCRTGVCQTCRTPLLSGQVRYVNEPLLPPPPAQVLLCSTRPDGDIVLDA